MDEIVLDADAWYLGSFYRLYLNDSRYDFAEYWNLMQSA